MQSLNARSYVTISVDDGHPTDLKTAELLASFNLRATFYIPARNPERQVMPDTDIKALAQAFEIGGHTMNHRPLSSLPPREAYREVVEGKQWLEALTGAPTVAFCYPRGKFNRRLVALVRQAGFSGARTCRFNLTGWPADPFLWGVSTHAYSHSTQVQLRHALLESNFRGFYDFFGTHHAATDWEMHFLHGLSRVASRGGIAHLYLHSWEIEERREWDKLRRVLCRIAAHPTLERVTNGELFRLWRSRNVPSQ
jgi:peptidoglycan/xylan/chitin deacetylase (PgdA/CDA1 family)